MPRARAATQGCYDAQASMWAGKNDKLLPASAPKGDGPMNRLVTRRQALAAASAVALAPFASRSGAQEKVGMQLILAADVSGSVNATRYRTQQEGYLEALGDPRVLNVIRELEPPVLGIA